METFWLGLVIGAAVTLTSVILLLVSRAWRHAFFSGAPIPLSTIVGMRLRGTPPSLIIDAYVALVKRGRTVDCSMIEATYLSEAGVLTKAHELADLVEKRLPPGAG